MRIPEVLEPLFDQGVIQDVVRPLMAGKEAQIYLVISNGRYAAAKCYKDSAHRSFKQRSTYTEGRKVRGSREQRAIDRGSKFGREQLEDAWRTAEVDAIYRLHAADVRVPTPYHFLDGVLVMELVCDADGQPAPRLADVSLPPERARALFHWLVREICKMLCAGIIHGDLSDFNVLLGADGPVIIDFPQWSDPAHNRNGRKLLIRDVDNVTQFLGRFAPELRKTRFGAEMWDLYERGQLLPDTPLTGRHETKKRARTDWLAEIESISREVADRRASLGLTLRPARKPVLRAPEPAPPPADPFDDLDALLTAEAPPARSSRRRR